MFERLTNRARKVMALANQEAQRFNHEYIGTEHVLLGLVKEGSGVGAEMLKNLGVDLRKVRLEVEKLIKSGPEMVTMGKLPQTPRCKRMIDFAIDEARNLNHNYVGTEHLLLGLLREEEGIGATVLMSLGLRLDDVRAEVLNTLGCSTVPTPAPAPARDPMEVRVLEKRLEPGKYNVVGWVPDGDSRVLVVKVKKGCIAVSVPVSMCKLEGPSKPVILEVQEGEGFRVPIIHPVEPIGESDEQR